jgi:GNAT superfamily N-acetyltransferase
MERSAAKVALLMSIESQARAFRIDATLRDGTPVCVRAIRPDDKERLSRGFAGLSKESVQRRFLHALAALSSEELRYLTELDFHDHVGLAVTVQDRAGETFIGVGRFIRLNDFPDAAEAAFTVADAFQRRGVASLLLRHLAALARSLGVRRFVALVQPDNRGMLEVFARSGLSVGTREENGLLRVSVELGLP